jgi:hypothetical protein
MDRFQTLPVTAIFMVITVGDGRILCGISNTVHEVANSRFIVKAKVITAVYSTFRRYGRIDIKFCTANSFTFWCLHNL